MDFQHTLAVLAVEDVRRRNVVQGVVLQRRRCRVKLRAAEGQRVGGAVAWSRADGADALGGGLQGGRWSLVKAVFLRPADKRAEECYLKKTD